MVGEIDQPFAQIRRVDEMIDDVERQQVRIAVGLVADVDQRLLFIVIFEEVLGADRVDQEAQGILLPARRRAGSASPG